MIYLVIALIIVGVCLAAAGLLPFVIFGGLVIGACFILKAITGWAFIITIAKIVGVLIVLGTLFALGCAIFGNSN